MGSRASVIRFGRRGRKRCAIEPPYGVALRREAADAGAGVPQGCEPCDTAGMEGSWWPVAATPPGCRGDASLLGEASVPAMGSRGTRSFGRRRHFLDGGARRCLRTGAVEKTECAAAVLDARRGATCSVGGARVEARNLSARR